MRSFFVFLSLAIIAFLLVTIIREESRGSSLDRIEMDEVEELVSEIRSRLVFVEGGSFLMGDYGISHGAEKLPLDSKARSKPLHEVRLTGYYIDRFKVTNKDFSLYLRVRGEARRKDYSRMHALFDSHPRLPAHMDWFEADNYCAWLASVSGFPFAMATEAQWEYAARSRGQFLIVSTDDGTYKYRFSESGEAIGINISSFQDRENFAKEQGWDTAGITPLPVDRFPPNPLGLYSMTDNGREWVKDWYDPDYYKSSPLDDPQGPEHPVHADYLGRNTKVMRGQALADEHWTVGVNVHRSPVNPNAYSLNHESVILAGKTARCVVNSEEPLK